jgi:tRNA(Ile2) C34 agmatinyltransferase TiaS
MGDIDRCTRCGGQLLPIGTLGSVAHYRCRQCGADEEHFNVQEDDNEPKSTAGDEPASRTRNHWE